VLIGHTKSTTAALAKLFETRALDKYYQVIVEGHLINLQSDKPSITIKTPVDNKPACSHARLLAYDPQQHRSMVEVKIESGRKHQIRIHMASIGHPVVGDRLHGVAKESDVNLQLTSCYLKFPCPITDQCKEFVLPERLRPTLSSLT